MSSQVIDGLNRLLADGTVLYQKLRHYHWNVEGSHFFELHAKFEELYTRWAITNDEIAERVLMIGGTPLHTLKAILHSATLAEDPEVPGPPEMVARIEADLNAILTSAGRVIGEAEEAGDRGTVNLLDALRDALEKDVWMLRAWLERVPAWK